MSTSIYHCSQQELYAACRLAWNTCATYLVEFGKFKTSYSAAFISLRLSETDAAESIAGAEKRDEDSRINRVLLKNKAAEALGFWQSLKRYIAAAFPEEQQPIKLDAAGQGYYRKAGREDWIAIQKLLLEGYTFISGNKEALVQDGSMPETFGPAFETVRSEYNLLFQEYLTASQNNGIETQEKVNANNSIYSKLMAMLLDGQEIFRNNEAVRKLFVFEQLLQTVGGTNTQGLKGQITLPGNQPVTGGEIIFSGPVQKTAKIDEEGFFECLQMPAADNYTVTIHAIGALTKVLTNVEVLKGTLRTMNIEAEENR